MLYFEVINCKCKKNYPLQKELTTNNVTIYSKTLPHCTSFNSILFYKSFIGLLTQTYFFVYWWIMVSIIQAFNNCSCLLSAWTEHHTFGFIIWMQMFFQLPHIEAFLLKYFNHSLFYLDFFFLPQSIFSFSLSFYTYPSKFKCCNKSRLTIIWSQCVKFTSFPYCWVHSVCSYL